MTELTPEPKATEAVVPEGVQQARAAFLRDFPALFADRKIRGRYVVYHKGERVAVARDYLSAIDEVNRLNLPDGEHLIIKATSESEAWEQIYAVEGEIDPV